ncbi:MAG: NuoM family protein, partial [Lysobacterales bacterium]
MQHYWLTLITFFPLLGALVLLLFPREAAEKFRRVALVVALAEFGLSLPLFFWFDANRSGMQFLERYVWISNPPIHYQVGVDGLSLFLILLTTFLTPLAVLASWPITHRVKEFFVLLLVLEAGMLGVFVALDLFLFYVFWEVMLIPMYLLIGIWGHQRRLYAAIKFILYTLAGSLLMLVGIIWLYIQTGTFDLLALYSLRYEMPGLLSLGAERWLFLAFFLAFAIKIPLFPNATREFAPAISALAIIGILYGALVALVQPDMKKLIAFSSIAHMGFIVLGIMAMNVISVQGAIYQMLSHGISTAMLFLLAGMLYDRRHTHLISEFGGLATPMPVLSSFLLLACLSSLGLPLLNGFVGEFLILLGVFEANVVHAALATFGVVLAAVYLL